MKKRLTNQDFLYEIKKREKELLIEEANFEVRKEFDESLKNVKINRSFSELYHIRAYNKAKSKEEKKKTDEIPIYELERLREKRNALLAKTDWMSLPDAPKMSDAWKKYRQDLRDITKTYKSMQDKGFAFPEEPKG